MSKKLLTTTFLLLISLSHPFLANAEVVKWAQNGAPVSTVDTIKLFPSITGDGSGGAFVAWEDYRNNRIDSNYQAAGDIFVQKVNVNGTPLLSTADGPDKKVNINDTEPKRNPAITKDGSGGAFVVWEDDRSPATGTDIYIQHINANGDRTWAEDKLVCFQSIYPNKGCPGDQWLPQIVLTTNGDVIVTWEDHRNDTNDITNADIYAQRVSIDINGNPVWEWISDGIAVTSASDDQLNPAISPDDSGGAVIVWEDWQNISGTPSTGIDIYGQRVNSSGVGQWPSDRIAITNTDKDQMFPAIATDGNNHFIITWEDYRDDFTSDIYAKGVDKDNLTTWFAETPVYKDTVTKSYQLYPRIAYSKGENSFIIAWEDYRNDVNKNFIADIYAQKITLTVSGDTVSGVIGWGSDGVPVSTATDTQDFVSITSSDTQGVIATWEDARSGTVYDIYATPLPIPGYIKINNGASNTISLNADLNLWASSFGSTVNQMCISNTISCDSWENYSETKSPWTLTSEGDSNKKVYVQFKDSLGQLSTVYYDEITLASMIIKNGEDYTTSTSVSLSIAATNCTMQFHNENDLNWSTPEVCASSKTWTLSSGDGLKTVYIKIIDASGESISSDTIILDSTRPTIELPTSPNNNDTGVALNPFITITFSEPIDENTINSANINLEKGGAPIESTLAYASPTKTVTLTPTTRLEINTTYTVNIKTGVKDLAGNEVFPYSFNFITIADNTPPTGSITINNGDLYTTTLTATLNITTDDATQMRFSADGSSWKSWKSYDTSATTTLPSGDGTKSVYVQFMDSVGNVSSPLDYYDDITLDTTPPTGTISINSGATYTNSASVTLTLSCTDTNGCSQMQFSNDNSTWSTAETYAASKAWILADGDGTKTVYLKFKDNAGNWSDAYSATIILDTTAPGPGSGVTPSILLDGAMETSGQTYYSFSKIVATWTSLSDTSAGLQEYKIAIGTTAGGTDILNWTGTAVPSYTTGDISSDYFGKTLYISVKAIDNLGSESSILSASFVYTPADINSKSGQGDGRVDGFDLGKLGIDFGSSNGGVADINRDGRVDGDDLIILGINFGKVKQ